MEINININVLIIFFLIISFAFLLYLYRYYSSIETIVSTIDNRNYNVQIRNDAQEAANLIAQVRQKLITLVDHMYRTYPSNPKVIKLKNNFNPDVLKEGIDDPKYTTYTVNKGEEIVLCLRTNGQLVNLNVLTFVCIHELSHIGNETIGHDEPFWEFFRELLLEAINIGVYTNYDYKAQNVQYCGMTITDSPLN